MANSKSKSSNNSKPITSTTSTSNPLSSSIHNSNIKVSSLSRDKNVGKRSPKSSKRKVPNLSAARFPNGLNPNLIDEIPQPSNISKHTTFLDLSRQNLSFLPKWLVNFKSLTELNLSQNRVSLTDHDLNVLRLMGRNLVSLNLSRNSIQRLPLERHTCQTLFSRILKKLTNLDLSSNEITDFEAVLLNENLEKLQLSGNDISSLPKFPIEMVKLRYLYLGFNKISILGESVEDLTNLKVLALNNNMLTSIRPNTFFRLTSLTTFHLHYNQISHLPRLVIDGLPNLQELSLRGNPLIDKFVRKRLMEGRKHTAPTLFELACRTIKMHDIKYTEENFSPYIISHLDMARKCPNPNCCGVYFDSQYLQVKFVDTCGAYRLPLLQYLCSPNCFEPSDPVTSGFSSSGNSEEAEGGLTATDQDSDATSFEENNNSTSESHSESTARRDGAADQTGTASRGFEGASEDADHTGVRQPSRRSAVEDMRIRVIVGGYNYTTEEIVEQIESRSDL